MPSPTKAVNSTKRPRRKTTQSTRSKVAQRPSRPKLRGVDLGWRQFQKDLAELMKNHAGTWVTYEGRTRVEFGTDRADLILRCLDRGLRPDEFMVCRIEPLGDEFSAPRRHADFG